MGMIGVWQVYVDCSVRWNYNELKLPDEAATESSPLECRWDFSAVGMGWDWQIRDQRYLMKFGLSSLFLPAFKSHPGWATLTFLHGGGIVHNEFHHFSYASNGFACKLSNSQVHLGGPLSPFLASTADDVPLEYEVLLTWADGVKFVWKQIRIVENTYCFRYELGKFIDIS